MSKVMVLFDFPGLTSDQYDKVWQDMRDAGHSNPKGLLYHVGAKSENGWKVVDVWESADSFNEFGKTLVPLLANNGVTPSEPVILPVHYEYKSS